MVCSLAHCSRSSSSGNSIDFCVCVSFSSSFLSFSPFLAFLSLLCSAVCVCVSPFSVMIIIPFFFPVSWATQGNSSALSPTCIEAENQRNEMHRKSSVKNKERKVVVLIQLFSFLTRWGEREERYLKIKKMGGVFIIHTEREQGWVDGGGGQWRPGYGKSRAEAERSTLLPLLYLYHPQQWRTPFLYDETFSFSLGGG